MAIEGQNPNPAGEPNQPNPAPGGDTGGQPNPQNTPNPQGQQPQGQTPQAPNPRDAGILRDLQAERKARQDRETRIQALETQLALAEKRTRALAGVEPRSQDDADADEVRQRFTALFPGLAKLNDADMLAKLESLLQNADVHADTTKRYWADRATQMTGAVVDKVAKEFGGQLSDRQIKQIRSAYAAAAESDPEFLARHEQGDPKLIEEFAAQWVEDWAGDRKSVV